MFPSSKICILTGAFPSGSCLCGPLDLVSVVPVHQMGCLPARGYRADRSKIKMRLLDFFFFRVSSSPRECQRGVASRGRFCNASEDETPPMALRFTECRCVPPCWRRKTDIKSAFTLADESNNESAIVVVDCLRCLLLLGKSSVPALCYLRKGKII